MQVQDEPEDTEPELITPEDLVPGNPFPLDAQRMGFDRYTGDGAGFLAIAANLDASKPSHRIFATMLLVTVVGSFLLTLWGQMH